MSKKSFVPDKPILMPLGGEDLVSYGDRLLFHQLALQIRKHREHMLTEQEFVDVVLGFYPDAVPDNVRQYRGYFNSKQATMGFGETDMPVKVEFVKPS